MHISSLYQISAVRRLGGVHSACLWLQLDGATSQYVHECMQTNTYDENKQTPASKQQPPRNSQQETSSKKHRDSHEIQQNKTKQKERTASNPIINQFISRGCNIHS